jgi:hypothetical protein
MHGSISIRVFKPGAHSHKLITKDHPQDPGLRHN